MHNERLTRLVTAAEDAHRCAATCRRYTSPGSSAIRTIWSAKLPVISRWMAVCAAVLGSHHDGTSGVVR